MVWEMVLSILNSPLFDAPQIPNCLAVRQGWQELGVDGHWRWIDLRGDRDPHFLVLLRKRRPSKIGSLGVPTVTRKRLQWAFQEFHHVHWIFWMILDMNINSENMVKNEFHHCLWIISSHHLMSFTVFIVFFSDDRETAFSNNHGNPGWIL